MGKKFIDIEKYRMTATKLHNLATELGGLRADIDSALGFVGDAWQGEASDAFMEAKGWTVKDIERLRFDMEDLAADIEAKVAAFEASMRGMVL